MKEESIVCYWVYFLSMRVNSRRLYSFKEFYVKCFFIAQCVCVSMWDKINGCYLKICECVLVGVEMFSKGVCFFCVYKATMVVDSQIQCSFSFPYILFFAAFTCYDVDDIVWFACEVFCDFENARGGCDRNGITGECRRAGEAALIRPLQ